MDYFCGIIKVFTGLRNGNLNTRLCSPLARYGGQVDAYISLGNYAYIILTFLSRSNLIIFIVFSAKKLGHQLIDENKRVCTILFWEKGEQSALFQVQTWQVKALSFAQWQ